MISMSREGIIYQRLTQNLPKLLPCDQRLEKGTKLRRTKFPRPGSRQLILGHLYNHWQPSKPKILWLFRNTYKNDRLTVSPLSVTNLEQAWPLLGSFIGVKYLTKPDCEYSATVLIPACQLLTFIPPVTTYLSPISTPQAYLHYVG